MQCIGNPKTAAHYTFPYSARFGSDSKAGNISDGRNNFQTIQFGILKGPFREQASRGGRNSTIAH